MDVELGLQVTESKGPLTEGENEASSAFEIDALAENGKLQH